jgi:hypothetical protein
MLAVAALYGCAAGVRSNDQRAGEPAAKEAITLTRSSEIEDARPHLDSEAWTVHDDGLSLKRTELHPDLGIGDMQFRTDQAGALNGDKDAALRVAHMFQRASNGVPRDERRAVLWLRRASDLNNGPASYELYLYYLERGLDREALRYEKRALDQGFVPPPRLDPRRG